MSALQSERGPSGEGTGKPVTSIRKLMTFCPELSETEG